MLQTDIQIMQKNWQHTLPELEVLTHTACDKTAALTALQHVAIPIELAITYTDDATIRTLNADYRNQDKPTNVLSFPAEEAIVEDIEALKRRKTPLHLGDVILAFETITKEAETQGKPLENHVSHLLVHGMLHLLGYDHIEDSDAEIMEALEVRILDALGIPNPYHHPQQP